MMPADGSFSLMVNFVALSAVMVDTSAHVYPMVGPGMGYKDMITGKYITARDATGGKFDDSSESF